MPSLHECPEDILPLAEHFREKFSKELKRQTEGFSPEAGRLMLSYRWPGNVRELQNKIKRAVLMARQPVIEAAELNIRQEETDGGINLFPETEAEEKHRKAAEMLHVDPSTLYRKMKKYGLLDR